MKHGIFTALAILVLSAGAATAQMSERRQITVTGEGQVEAAPDMATITLGVTHQDEEAKAAMDATSDAVARVLQRLTELGVEARDMQTRNLSLNPVWSNRPSAQGADNRITGFVASNTVLVRVRDLDGLGEVLDAVIADGANDFNGLSFSVQEPDPLMEEARRRAVQDASERARLLAEAAGVTLGPVHQIMDQSGGGAPIMMEMAAAARSGVPVAAGEVTLNANVTVIFDITD
jgi:hypothetical protein